LGNDQMNLAQWERRKKAYLSRQAKWVAEYGQFQDTDKKAYENVQLFLKGTTNVPAILSFVVNWDAGHGEFLALTGQQNWDTHLAKYVAYKSNDELWEGHWFARVLRRTPTPTSATQKAALPIAHMLTLGWESEAIAYGKEMLPRVERGFYPILNNDDAPGSRAGKFIMRLFADWQNTPPTCHST
jgi:hypothetical protein